jgi:hypothetical protein
MSQLRLDLAERALDDFDRAAEVVPGDDQRLRHRDHVALAHLERQPLRRQHGW